MADKEKTVNQATLERVVLDETRLAAYRAALGKLDVPAEEHPLLARLLAYYDVPVEQVANFLDPKEEPSLPEPFALLDMKAGTDLIIDSVKAKKKIAVWADYDADGNTSAAILGHTLEAIGADDTTLTIPYRTEGFGLNIPGIRKLRDEGVEVLVVADSGTVAHDQIAEARRLGMEVLVLDHHQPRPGEELPDALVVNPNRSDDPSPHGALAAASVSYVFARDLKLNLQERGEGELAEHIDFDRLRAISAIGVVADVVGLNDSANRYVVKEGLKQINSRKYPGLNVLKDLYGDRLSREELTAEDLAFTFGPAINAAGRLGDPTIGMKLLMARTEEEAAPLAKQIKAVNEERKIITEQVYRDAEKAAEEYLAAHPDASFLMVENEKWHYGVVGIVAGRLKEKYGLPTAVGHSYTAENGEKRATYSVRSVEGVDFFGHAVVPIESEHVPGVLKIGGHAMAAGMTIRLDDKENIRQFADGKLAEPMRSAREGKTIRYLDALPLETLQSGAFQRAYERMEPFGQLMRRPLYLAEGVQVKGIRRVGKDNEHLQFSLGRAGEEFAAEEAVRGGVLFRGMGTALGAVLTSPTRRDERMDMVIDPFVKKLNGEARVGFLPVDVARVERLGQIISGEELSERSDALLEHREESRKAAQDKLQALPRKISDLRDESNKDAQAALKILHDSNVALLDTETTGLEAGADSPGKANGLTQVAMIAGRQRTSDSKPNGIYAAREYNQPILPVSPAHFGWKHAVEQGADAAYDRAVHEYTISPDALAVTNTSFRRNDGVEGPISAMFIGPVKQDAKPFYEIAPKLAEWLVNHTPAAYNAPFDMPVLVRHLSDVLDACPGHKEPRLNIPQEAWEEWQSKVRAPLQKALRVPADKRDLPGIEQLPETLSNPARHVCLMHGAMVHKGFSTQQRLQHIAPQQYGVAFEQDDTAHDALADVGPLVYLLADQYRDFGGKMPDMAGLWQELVQKAIAEGKAESLENGDIHVTLGKGAALLPFFAAFREVGERNPRTKAYIGIRDIGPDGVTLIGREKERDDDKKPEYYKQPRHIGLLKKTLSHLDMAELEQVIRAEPFDSTSALDITFTNAAGGEVTLEDIPISALRASTPFLKAHPDRLEDNLRLIQSLGSGDRVGRVVLEEDGITVKGHHGRFGEVKFLAPLAEWQGDTQALADSVQTHLDFLMKVGAVPGVHSTTRELGDGFGEDAPDDGESPAAEPVTYVRLGNKHNLLMEVRKDLLECVAERMGVDTGKLPAQLAGGATVHYDDAQGVYLIEGTVENFREINLPLRDASWLLHRLNNLPGIYSGETELHNRQVTLHFNDGVPMETLQILEQAHVPFTAEKDAIIVPLDMMMNDPFHWSQEIGAQKQQVRNNLRRAKPLPAPEYLQVLHRALLDGTIVDFEHGRDGRIWVCDSRHADLPFDKTAPAIVDDGTGHVDLQRSSIMTIPSIGKIDHAGLRYQLSKLGGMERVGAPRVSMRLDRVTLTAPTLEPLGDTGYSRELRELAQHMQSVHISPLLDDLREIVTSEDMAIPHHDDPARYMEQAGRLAGWVEAHEDLFDKLGGEIDDILDKELEYRFEKGTHRIYNDVADLLLMEHTLKSQDELGNLSLPDENVRPVLGAVREYADGLEKLEFQRERVRSGCVDVQKRMLGFSEGSTSRAESVAKAVAAYHVAAMAAEPGKAAEHEAGARKWLEKIYPTDAEVLRNHAALEGKDVARICKGNVKKIDDFIAKGQEQGEHQAFQLVRQLSGGLDKLWEEARAFNRSLVFSRELIDGAVALDSEDKRGLVQEASALLHATAAQNALKTLRVLEREGGVKDVQQGKDGKISFDASPMLTDPERWSARLSELNTGKHPYPDAPYVAYDTSTLLTLLLAHENVPGHPDVGLLASVRDMAELGVETPVLTDMVLAEFLYSAAPLTPQDLFRFDERGKATDILYTPERMSRVENGVTVLYPKAQERLEFLRDLYNTGHVVFAETRTGREYLDAVRHSPELQKTLTQRAPEGTKPLVHRSDAELKELLLDWQAEHHAPLMRKIRQQRLRNDTGEVSIADAMLDLRSEHGRGLPVYVRYEGTDVRGRIIQRVNEPERPYNSPVDKRYDPYNSRDPENRLAANFDRASLAALGEGGFQSTGGMFMALAAMLNREGAYVFNAGEIDRNLADDGNLQWVPRQPENAYAEGTVQRAYADMLTQVGQSLGAERRYNAVKDVRFADIEYNVKPENALVTGKPSPQFDHLMAQDGPVRRQLAERHMDRLAEYLGKLADKLEAKARTARENVDRVRGSIDALKGLQREQGSAADRPEAKPEAGFAGRVTGNAVPGGGWAARRKAEGEQGMRREGRF